jgi:uncharacterized protein YbgA (DUF1722 family)/uncharacterized protein YbbK (DUF523 family)
MGVSSCLLGEPVRWDGSHRRDRYVTDTLGRYFEFVPVCPEVEAGFGLPREPMRLVGDPADPRLVISKTGVDVTDRLTDWAQHRLDELGSADLSGFIFRRDSPSSGMERVKVRSPKGMVAGRGRGLFSRAFMERFPLIPVEEDGRLNDPALRENFLERVFAFKRWRDHVVARPTRGALVAFHAHHKLLLMAHSPEHYRSLGRLVGNVADRDLEEAVAEYQDGLMTALKRLATRPKHRNVLQHAMGYFKNDLSFDEKEEMRELIEAFSRGELPLIVPVTLVNHYVRKYRQPYLAEQYYLHPHPAELGLRNHP